MSSNDLTGYPSEYEYHRRQVADLTAERDNLRKLLAAARELAHGRWPESWSKPTSAPTKMDDISAFWRRVDAALQEAKHE